MPTPNETLRLGALLHDIGKIGVPDEVLRKSGALTAAEFEAIKTHPSAGARILRSIPFLAPHIPIVELHHERPDGLGYPYGLRGDDIPLAARIVHVADAFDAMTSARAYRSGRMPVEAIAELRRCVGTDFDGVSVEALIAALPRLVRGRLSLDSMPIVIQLALTRMRPDAAGLHASPPCGRRVARRRRSRRRSRVALDVVAAADVDARLAGDANSTVLVRCVRRGADCRQVSICRARPVVFRRSFDGAWQDADVRAGVRYERPGAVGGVGLRFDAGQLPSPIGLSMLENRPDKNPVVSQHSTLYSADPALRTRQAARHSCSRRRIRSARRSRCPARSGMRARP